MSRAFLTRAVTLGVLLTALGARTLPAQRLDVKAVEQRGTVGDVLSFVVTLRLPAGMELVDPAPRTLVPPPPGTRIIATDTLRPGDDGTMTGRVQIAFYRVGLQPVPVLALLYRRAPGESFDTLVHYPVSVEIVPTLDPGNPPLRDIRSLRALGGPRWLPLVMLATGIGAGIWWLRRRARTTAKPPAVVLTVPAGPFERALARLDEIEAASRASGNGIMPLYAGTAMVLRTCLEEAGILANSGLTTPEVLRLLPPDLGEGRLGEQCAAILRDGDLVKFAGVRPDLDAALTHSARARNLVRGWQTALTAGSPVAPAESA